MDLNNLSFGQRIDPENGLVELWLTHSCLDWIKQQDWSYKVLWVWGAGLGDAWMAKRCKEMFVVERNEEWLNTASNICSANGVSNVHYLHRPCNEGDASKYDFYTDIPKEISPDIILVDDVMRYECILKALEIKPQVLIVDNWQQDYVFLCPSAEEVLSKYKGEIYPQLDHRDHEGNCWKTGIFFIK